MPRNDDPSWWLWAAGSVAAAAAGSAVVLAAYAGRRGPPPEGSLTPRGRGPDPVELDGLPSPGDKAQSYPRGRGSAAPPSTWEQLQPTPFVAVRNPDKAWGTPGMIDTIAKSAGRFSASAIPAGLVDARVRVSDISKQGGGPLAPHKSHQQGRDADVTIAGLEGGKLPSVALPTLLRAFLEDDNVQVIFLSWGRQRDVWDALDINPELDPDGLVRRELQFPLAAGSGRTRVRHWDGHRNHIHVRTVA